jgi:hypothetical protein
MQDPRRTSRHDRRRMNRPSRLRLRRTIGALGWEHRLVIIAWRLRGRESKGTGSEPASAATALSVVASLAGCAAIQQTFGGWFGGAPPTPTAQPAAVAGAQAPRVYDVRTDGLKVYSEASASSTVVGTLALYEKVTRTRLDRGYACVESSQSGVKGWVNNAELIWRLPSAPTTGAPAPAEPEPEEPAAPAPISRASPSAAALRPVWSVRVAGDTAGRGAVDLQSVLSNRRSHASVGRCDE